MSDLLPAAERLNRAALESVVRTNVGAVREWLLALLQLHDRKLYKETHSSWDAYVLETFGYSHSTAVRWLAQGREMLALETTSDGSANKTAGQDRPRADRFDSESVQVPSQRQAQRARRDPIPAASTVVPVVTQAATPSPAPTIYRPPARLPDPGPPASVRASVAHLIDHLHALDPDEAGRAMTAAQLDVAMDWMEHAAKAAPRRAKPSAKKVLLGRKAPATRGNDCTHPITRRLGTGCGVCGVDPVPK